jgi:hypothetical protein
MVHCDLFSTKCYTVISKKVGSTTVKYDIGYFDASTGSSTFKEVGSDTTS